MGKNTKIKIYDENSMVETSLLFNVLAFYVG